MEKGSKSLLGQQTQVEISKCSLKIKRLTEVAQSALNESFCW